MHNSVKQIIMLGLEKHASPEPPTSVKSVMNTPISVNGAAAAAPAPAPRATSQISRGAGTPITQQQQVIPPAQAPSQDLYKGLPGALPPDSSAARQAANNRYDAEQAAFYNELDNDLTSAYANAQAAGQPGTEAPAQAPAQAPATQPVYPEEQRSQPGTPPPNPLNINVTSDFTPLGEDPVAQVLSDYDRPTQQAASNALARVQAGSLPREEDLDIVYKSHNFSPDTLGIEKFRLDRNNGQPSREKIPNITAQEEQIQNKKPGEGAQDPDFMQKLSDKWNGMDDTQKLGLMVGVPMALIGLFSGAMGGNKWLAGILGLAGAAGVGHSMGAFDKLIPGWDKMQKGMKTLDTTMAEIEQMPEGDAKNYMISQAYQQAREQGGGSFSVASLMPTTSANRLSSAYGQLDHENMPSYDRSTPQGMYDEFETGLNAYNQLKPGATRDLVRKQMMTASNQQKDVQRLNSMMEAASQLKPSPEKDHFIRQIHAAANQGEAKRGFGLMSQMEGTPAHQLAQEVGSLGEAPELDGSANLNMSLNVWKMLPEGRAKDDYLKEINQRVSDNSGLGIQHWAGRTTGTIGRMFGYEDSPLNRLDRVNAADAAAKNKQPQ